MRSLVKMLFITAILVYGSAYAQSTLIEDWESVTTLPSANWDIRFENPSTVYPFVEAAGNPGQALNPGGQGHLKSCIVYNTTFQPDYSIGMEIDFDAYLVSTGSHYTDIVIDLMKDINAWSANDFLVLRMHLNKNGVNQRKVWMQLQSQDTLHTELMVIDGAYNSDAWNHGKIIIREDKRVEFFVNGTLLWTSTKTIDPAYSTSTKLAIGGQSFGGPARMDNLRVRNGLAGLVAYYRFAGNTLDATDYHNDVAVVAGAVPTADRMGNLNSAYQFDGNNDYLMIPDSPSLHSTRLTVAAWVKVDAIHSLHQAIVAKYWGTTNDHSGRSWTFELSPNDAHPKFTGVWSGVNTAIASSNSVNIGHWTFLAATFDGAAIRIYENGELTTTLPKSGDLDLGTHELTIGSTCTTGLDNTWFKGAIDEVMVFNRALSAEEVALLYEPIPDKLRIGQGTDCLLSWEPTEQVFPIYLDNRDTVKAGDIPLSYDWSYDPDSISFVETRFADMDFKTRILDSAENIIRIGFVADFGGSGNVLAPIDDVTREIPVANVFFHMPYGCSESWVQPLDTCSVVLEADAISLELIDKFDQPYMPIVLRDSTKALQYRLGDCDMNGSISVSDAVCMISYIFSGGSAACLGSFDANCDELQSISDPVYVISYIFGGGPVPGSNCLCGTPPFAKTTIGHADISTATTSGEDVREIAVNIDATSNARAVQLDFTFTGDVRNIQIKSNVSDLQLFSSEIESGYRVGLIDLTGTAAIPSGKAQIATITYEGDGELAITSAIVVDNDADEMNVAISNAKLENVLPTEYSLSQNQPNPFNPSTDISFSLPKTGQVKLVVYNILGAEVATLVDEVRSAGTHRVTWDGTDKSGNPVASGVYLYRLTTGDFAETKKMVLMK